MSRPQAAAIIGLSARRAAARDLHDLWADRLAGRSTASGSEILSLEHELYSLIVGAWADAFGETTPRRLLTFFTTFGDALVDANSARRVIHRIGGQFAEPPS